MPYNLKIEGIQDAEKFLQDEVKKVKIIIQEINDNQFKMKVDGLSIDFSVKEGGLGEFLSSLSEKFTKAHNQTINDIALKLEEALDASIQNPVWDWKGDNRDIVDTGRLKDSLVVSVQNGEITISYGAEYAAIVHYGGYFNPYGNPEVKQYYPGRPWVSSVLFGQGPVEQFDFKKEYGSIFSKRLAALT